MLTKLMFAITTLSSVVVPLGPTTNNDDDSNFTAYDLLYVYTSIVGPYSPSDDNEIMTLSVNYPDERKYYPNLENYINVSPHLIINGMEYNEHDETTKMVSAGNTTSWDYNFYITTNKYYDKNTVTITLHDGVYHADNVVWSGSTTYYTVHDGSYEMKGSFSPRELYFQYYSYSKYKATNESYNFDSIDGYLYPDSCNSLNLDISFNYYCGGLPTNKEYNHGDAYLVIYDYADIYPHINKTEGKNGFRVPLDVSYDYDNSMVSLSFKEGQFYVDPHTLDMYDKDNGSTNLNLAAATSFRVPIGKTEGAANNVYELYLEDAGFNIATFYRDLTYLPSKGYFGSDCNKNNYCLVGQKDD